MTLKLITATERQALPAKQVRSFMALMAALAAWLRDGADRARQRRALSRLNDFDLRDIGLTRRDVADETAKPFWQI